MPLYLLCRKVFKLNVQHTWRYENDVINDATLNFQFQANLFYDLKTSSSTSFTEIAFYDYFNHESKKFDGRYNEITYNNGDNYPGETIAPIEVDIMFQIISINQSDDLENPYLIPALAAKTTGHVVQTTSESGLNTCSPRMKTEPPPLWSLSSKSSSVVSLSIVVPDWTKISWIKWSNLVCCKAKPKVL